MSQRALFETDARALAEAKVAHASTSAPMDDEVRARQLLSEALARLDQNPDLFSGDPEGVFTYEDPILAVAALWHQAGPEVAARVGTAAAGERLKNTSVFNWMLTGISAWLNRDDKDYITLAGLTPAGPIRTNQETVRLALVGDAGYNGLAQAKVIRYIRELHRARPLDFIIHLGDTYFAGSAAETLTNLLDPFSGFGSAKFFTLCGNHDLYHGAQGYLSALKVLGQPGRYFSIETPSWRLACLDTALDARKILRDDGQLDDGQLAWLERLMGEDDHKPLILLSHHFILSAWCTPPRSLTQQLGEWIKERGQVIAWYWGHEHGCVAYEREPHGFYGACVGNGAFLEKWEPPERPELVRWYAQGRCHCYDDSGSSFWPHGFLELELTPAQLIETYHVEGGEDFQRVIPHPQGPAPASAAKR